VTLGRVSILDYFWRFFVNVSVVSGILFYFLLLVNEFAYVNTSGSSCILKEINKSLQIFV
jgi:hypothetical protein